MTLKHYKSQSHTIKDNKFVRFHLLPFVISTPIKTGQKTIIHFQIKREHNFPILTPDVIKP